jgi:curved DNA-binding protein
VKDLYSVLGVDRSADAASIKKAYRQLTREHHPDKNPGDKQAEERFKDVSGAYEVLGDADKRKLYDEFGEMSLTQGFDPQRARAYRQAQQRPPGFGGRGGNVGGGQFGSGQFGGDDFGSVFGSYDEANHTSFDDLLSRLFGGGRVDERTVRRSGGRGADVRGEVKVSLLAAILGVTVPLRIDGPSGSRTLDVKVPPGMPDGGTLRLRGQGGGGKPAGDVLLTVRVEEHPRLSRSGLDLKLRVPVSALEAYRGGPIDVPTPWGPVTLKLPPGSQNGQTLRLRGKGIQTKAATGDLLVTIDVRMPATAGDEPLLEALTRVQGAEDVRAGLSL